MGIKKGKSFAGSGLGVLKTWTAVVVGVATATALAGEGLPCLNPHAAWTQVLATLRILDGAIGANGEVIIVGYFGVTQDFDPGERVDLRTAEGLSDAFVTAFGADGAYLWTYTAGGPGGNAVDLSHSHSIRPSFDPLVYSPLGDPRL